MSAAIQECIAIRAKWRANSRSSFLYLAHVHARGGENGGVDGASM